MDIPKRSLGARISTRLSDLTVVAVRKPNMCRRVQAVACLLSTGLTLLVTARVAVADPPAEPDAAVPEVLKSADGRCSLGATALFGIATAGDVRPLACLAVLQAGDERQCWTLVDTARVRPFADAWRDWVTDEKPIQSDPLEVEAYAQTLILAHTTATKALEKHARADLTFVQLFREPAKYRGEVVRIGGRMKRIRRYDDPPERARQAGISHIYEGWLFNDDFGANPVCCVFTDLPEGLRVAETMEEKVDFVGYFFKRYRYKAGDTPKPNQWRDAPLIIGRVASVSPMRNASTTDDWGRTLAPIFLSLIGGTAAFVVLLTLWLRRGDDRARRRLTDVTRRQFEPRAESGTDSDPQG